MYEPVMERVVVEVRDHMFQGEWGRRWEVPVLRRLGLRTCSSREKSSLPPVPVQRDCVCEVVPARERQAVYGEHHKHESEHHRGLQRKRPSMLLRRCLVRVPG